VPDHVIPPPVILPFMPSNFKLPLLLVNTPPLIIQPPIFPLLKYESPFLVIFQPVPAV